MTNNGPREIPMMMKSFLMPMVLDLSKWKSRRIGEQWKRVKVGDRVWMREAYKIVDWDYDAFPYVQYADGSIRRIGNVYSGKEAERFFDIFMELSDNKVDGKACDQKWRPAVHMPRSVCRFVGEVTSTRQERLQDITEADAIAEGMEKLFLTEHFSSLRWERTMDKTWNVEPINRRTFARLMELMTPGIWAKNPVVTVIEWRKA